MTRSTFEQWRLPVALVLVIIAAFVLLPRGGDSDPAAAGASPRAGAVVGEPGGQIVATPSPTPQPTATPAPTPTRSPRATPTVTPQPAAEPPSADGFTAQVLACRSISGSTCNGRLGTLPSGASSFTALVLFSDANAGDTINVVLSGPSGQVVGGPYTLGGSGDGYFYSTFFTGGLPNGEYGLVATRNGEPVATTSFRRGG